MLRDAAGLVRLHMRVADAIEERRLAVVDVAHDRNDRRTELQALRVVLDFGDLRRVDVRRQLFARDAKLRRDERGRIEIDFLVDRRHDAHEEQLLDDFRRRAAHLRREVFDGDGFRQLDVLRARDLDLRRWLLTAAAAVRLRIAAFLLRAVTVLAATLTATTILTALIAAVLATTSAFVIAASIAATAIAATVLRRHGDAGTRRAAATRATASFMILPATCATAFPFRRFRMRRRL